MGGPDSRGAESALRALHFARRAAEQARRAAQHAAEIAARQEQMAGLGLPEARVHTRVAAMHRRGEACQRAAERMHRDFARKLGRWAMRDDADLLLRPVLMSAVANTAGWRGAVLSVSDLTGAETLVAASDETARRAHELEVTLSEGPYWEALRGGAPTARGPEVELRWPRYGVAVADLGVRAVAAVPVDLGDGGMGGALTFTGATVPTLADRSCGLGEVAEALGQTVLQAPDLVFVDEAGMPGLEVFQDEDFQPGMHQAAGLLHARFGWGIENAVALIRAHAFAEDRPIAEVAAEICRIGRLDP